jgi:protoheme IX farnesyltransferase
VVGFTALLCIAIGAGAAGALNMWYDADVDALMSRTTARPIPRGRILPGEALAFGLTTAAASVIALGLVTNVAATSLLAFTIFFYIVVYTMWLNLDAAEHRHWAALVKASGPRWNDDLAQRPSE